MNLYNTIRGRKGEEIACQYLESEGHDLLFRNFRNRLGEIDIISIKKDSIFFIEVKNWNKNLISPLEIFTKKKVFVMRSLAEFFFFKNPEYSNKFFVSFGLIEVSKEKVLFHRDLF